MARPPARLLSTAPHAKVDPPATDHFDRCQGARSTRCRRTGASTPARGGGTARSAVGGDAGPTLPMRPRRLATSPQGGGRRSAAARRTGAAPMTASADALPYGAAPRGVVARVLGSRFVAVLVIAVLIVAVWYVGAFFLNAPFQRELSARAGGEISVGDFIGATLSQDRSRCCRRRTRSRSSSTRRPCAARQPSKREPPLSRLGHALLDARSASSSARSSASLLAVGIVHVREPRPEPDAVDHLLADDPDPGHRADLIVVVSRLCRSAVDRPLHRQGADLDLSVVLPGHRRHGEGPALARPDPSRPDAHLQRQPLRRPSGSCAGRRRCRSCSPR